MVSFNLKVLAKFGLCSTCSLKLDECSFARARKIFATARMLGFSLKCAQFLYGKTGIGNIGEACTRYECFQRRLSRFADLTHGTILRERPPQR